MSTEPFRFPNHPGKDPAESVPVTLDWFNICANFWRANEIYTVADFIRPSRATGFAYECTSGGTSGRSEPLRWPTRIDETVTDGSVTWTCRAAGANGLNVVSNPQVLADPVGALTISNVSAVENTKVAATYAGGVLGEACDAVCTVTINGVPRVGRQRVPIVKR